MHQSAGRARRACYAAAVPCSPEKALRRTVPSAYIPLIGRMRFYIEPEISCSRFFGRACFAEESTRRYRETGDHSVLQRTDLGVFIAERLNGGLFIDVPCGLHDARDRGADFPLPALAAALGASAMWEADLTADVVRGRVPAVIDVLGGGYALAEGPGDIGVRTDAGMPVYTLQDDLLGFLAKIDPAALGLPKALYLSALQPDGEACTDDSFQRETAVPYLEGLYDELARVSLRDDLVILCSSAMLAEGIDESLHMRAHPALALPPRGFTLMRRDALDKVHVFVRD